MRFISYRRPLSLPLEYAIHQLVWFWNRIRFLFLAGWLSQESLTKVSSSPAVIFSLLEFLCNFSFSNFFHPMSWLAVTFRTQEINSLSQPDVWIKFEIRFGTLTFHLETSDSVFNVPNSVSISLLLLLMVNDVLFLLREYVLWTSNFKELRICLMGHRVETASGRY